MSVNAYMGEVKVPMKDIRDAKNIKAKVYPCQQERGTVDGQVWKTIYPRLPWSGKTPPVRLQQQHSLGLPQFYHQNLSFIGFVLAGSCVLIKDRNASTKNMPVINSVLM